jgi:DNA-binding FadR family transcriptional regulator
MEAITDPAEPGARATWSASDRLFHRQLAAMTGNPVLLAFADHVATLMDQPLWHRLRDDSIAVPGRTRIHAAEHRMIYEAIVDGDAEAAAFYSAQHINRVRTYMELGQ